MTWAQHHRHRMFAPVFRYGLIAVLPLSIGSVVHASTDLSVNTSLNARVSNNPYLSGGDNQGAASVIAAITPILTMRDEATELTFSGTVQHSEFDRIYPSSDAVSAAVNGRWRFSPRWTATTSASFDDSIVGETDFFDFGNTVPGTTPPPTLDDITLVGTRIKRRSIGVQAGLMFQPNARETANIGFFANNSRALGVINDQSYATYGNSFSYSRQVSRRTSAGITTAVSRYECRSQGRCFVNSFQPEVTISTGIGIDWTFKASAGATISQIRLPSESRDTVTPAGSASLCRERSRLSMCLTASQTVSTSGGTGARPSLSLGSTANYRLDQRSNLGVYLAYSKSGASAFSQQDYSYLSARITGSREIARRLSFTVDGGYDRSETPSIGNRSAVSVSMGLSYSLGRVL